MPATPLIPPEPEEWNPDPFRFLYAAMGLLSFSFQGNMSKKNIYLWEKFQEKPDPEQHPTAEWLQTRS